jgi:phosphate transport system substrate-binding protein
MVERRLRHRSGVLGIWFALLFALFGCGAAVATPAPTVITIAGATELHPVLQELTAEFTRRHPNVIFTLRGGSSTTGEEQALTQRVDLGASTLFPPEAPGPVERLLVRTPIGSDGLAIIVHSSNSVPGLTFEQTRRLFSGEILSWDGVGGDAREVILVSREDGSGSRILFEDRIMGDEAVSLTAVVMPSSRDVVDYVAKTPGAIAYVSRAWVMPPGDRGDAPAPRVRPLPIEGMLPTLDTLATGDYPLRQPLYLVSRGEPRGWVRQFVEFVLSPAGQAIVARYHQPAR